MPHFCLEFSRVSIKTMIASKNYDRPKPTGKCGIF
jgi:hypothetical protein